MAIDTVETNALMMVRLGMRVKIKKACELRNRENIRERSDKPADKYWVENENYRQGILDDGDSISPKYQPR